ncbi:MAG: VOC family protein [Rhodospirillales bacterium]|nr:VOC family protein [Rhodospirillales bacterium]
MEQRISLITLGVESIARASVFYTRLGWQPSPLSNDNVTFFQAGGSIFGLYGQAALTADAGLAPETAPEGISARSSLAYNARTREEVDAVLKEAKDAGAEIVKPAEDTFWGGYSGYFADPDGHLWEVAWNPHFPIDEDGSIRLPE